MAAPAYNGAKFDIDGFCRVHADIRMCTVTEDGKYKIVRKLCSKCPNSGARSNSHRSKLHGYRKTPIPQRVVPNQHQHHHHHHHHATKSSNATHYIRGEQIKIIDKPFNSPPPSPRRKVGQRRRRRTLSPVRRSIQKGSSVHKPPASTGTSCKKKVTEEKLRALMNLMPPLHCGPNSSKGVSSSRKDRQSNGLRGSLQGKPGQSYKAEMPFDGNGYCRAHPEVQLAEQNLKGEWHVVSGICPQCCAFFVMKGETMKDGDEAKFEGSAVLACSKKESPSTDTSSRAAPQSMRSSSIKSSPKNSDSIIGKVLDTNKTSSVSPSEPKEIPNMKSRRMKSRDSSTPVNPPPQPLKSSIRSSTEELDALIGKVLETRRTVLEGKQCQSKCTTVAQSIMAERPSLVKKSSAKKISADHSNGTKLPKKGSSSSVGKKNQAFTPPQPPKPPVKQPTIDLSEKLSKNSRTKRCDSNGSLKSGYSHQTLRTSTSSSIPPTPESISKPAFSTDYFTGANGVANSNIIGLALDIYEGERMVAELNNDDLHGSYVSQSTIVQSNKAAGRDASPSREPPDVRLRSSMCRGW